MEMSDVVSKLESIKKAAGGVKFLVVMREINNRWYAAPVIVDPRDKSAEELQCISFNTMDDMNENVATLAAAVEADAFIFAKVYGEEVRFSVNDSKGDEIGRTMDGTASMRKAMPEGSDIWHLLGGLVPAGALTNEEAIAAANEAMDCKTCDEPNCPGRTAPKVDDGGLTPEKIKSLIAEKLGIDPSVINVIELELPGNLGKTLQA